MDEYILKVTEKELEHIITQLKASKYLSLLVAKIMIQVKEQTNIED